MSDGRQPGTLGGVRRLLLFGLMLASGRILQAQTPDEHLQHAQPAASWSLMYDGVAFVTLSHQTGPRGGDEIVSTNWLMGMATGQAGPGRLSLTGMLSLEPATMGPRGYRELFQVGETYHFLPIVDHQHPHDLLMQASAAWRLPLNDTTTLTLVGAPVGEATLGPVVYMHRPSAAENSVAPLGHHTMDSTHITMGVISARVDRGAWLFESSVFQSAEPDENRWDLVDFGPLDSWAARVTYRRSGWELQGSHGFLKNPERLEFAYIRRTTTSASWFKTAPGGFTAATFAVGRNDKQFHGTFYTALAEATMRRRRFSAYGRFETVQVETQLLLSNGLFHTHTRTPSDVVVAGTAGGVIEMPQWRRFEAGIGAEITSYIVPDALRATYSDHPYAFRVFLRVRPPVGAMGRMWNMHVMGH
jgi:hypothetical protein